MKTYQIESEELFAGGVETFKKEESFLFEVRGSAGWQLVTAMWIVPFMHYIFQREVPSMPPNTGPR